MAAPFHLLKEPDIIQVLGCPAADFCRFLNGGQIQRVSLIQVGVLEEYSLDDL